MQKVLIKLLNQIQLLLISSALLKFKLGNEIRYNLFKELSRRTIILAN